MTQPARGNKNVLRQLRGAVGTVAQTAALTTITPADAEGTPDYAIAAITNSTPYGFASAQEAISLLYVIKNLQERVLELEAVQRSLTVAESA